MHTQCNAEQLEFSCVGRRRVVGAFDGGRVSSDAGALLAQSGGHPPLETAQVADCHTPTRSPVIGLRRQRTGR